jgi:hypothetical protein
MKNFIGVYENAFSKKYCEKSIEYFNKMEKCGFVKNRIENDNAIKIQKEDNAYFAHDILQLNFQSSGSMFLQFNETFWKIYKENYAVEYAALQNSGPHNNYCFKMQKTPIGGGYHTWHFEAADRENCQRLLTWMVYLNDVEEGGETEFLYQHLRIKPKQGTLVIWPAAFTHTHRGNPPLSNEKYIVTGWTEF